MESPEVLSPRKADRRCKVKSIVAVEGTSKFFLMVMPYHSCPLLEKLAATAAETVVAWSLSRASSAPTFEAHSLKK